MGMELARRGHVVDAALAVGVAALVLVNAALATDGAGRLDYLLLTVASLVLAAHSRAPRLALVVSALCVFEYLRRVGPDPIAVVPVLIGVYAAVAAGHRVIAIAASTPFIVFGFLANPTLDGIVPVGWFLAAAVLGEVARARRAYLHQVERRAAEAERTREETAHRRAADERLRIARELHDSLTHSISVIKVQAGVAVHLARKRGEEVPPALLAIQEASRDAVRELRATLDVLRTDGTYDGAGSDDAPPSIGLSHLDELVKHTRSAGLPTTVAVTGTQRMLPDEVDRAAYRIVQEALTNITRHAGPATAQVEIGYELETLTVRIDDDGQAAPDAPPTPGVGLRGMAERVATLGGRLTAEPRPEGGFTVRAELPVKEKQP